MASMFPLAEIHNAFLLLIYIYSLETGDLLNFFLFYSCDSKRFFIAAKLIISLWVIRNDLFNSLDILREEQSNMEKDLKALHMRWLNLREEKQKLTGILSNISRIEEELDRLDGERSQIEFDMMVHLFVNVLK